MRMMLSLEIRAGGQALVCTITALIGVHRLSPIALRQRAQATEAREDQAKTRTLLKARTAQTAREEGGRAISTAS